MFLHDAAVGPAHLSNGQLLLPPLDTTLRRVGATLTGTFGLSHLPVVLHRVATFPPPATSATSPNPSPRSAPPPTGPPPQWSTPLNAALWSAPAVFEKSIYLGAADGNFHALDAATGRIRWTWRGPNPLYGTALVTADFVTFLDSQHDLVCLHRRDGTLAWRRPLHDAILAGAALKPDETFNRRTATPVLHAGTLYLGSSDGGIYALDPATGEIRHRHDAKTKIYATATHDDAAGELLFAGLDGTLLAFDPRTKKETRRTKLPGALTSAPVVAGDRIILGCRNYTLYGLHRADLSVAWQFSFWFSWIESTPALVDGTLYLGGSDFARITALDPATGRARWSTVVHGLAWGTPLVTADAVFAGTSAQAGALIPHTGGLAALDRRTGELTSRRLLPLEPPHLRSGVLNSLARAEDLLIAATFDGAVQAFPIHGW